MQNIFAIRKVFYGFHLLLTCLIAFAAQGARPAVVGQPCERVTTEAELWPWDGLATAVTGAAKKHWEKTDIMMGKA